MRGLLEIRMQDSADQFILLLKCNGKPAVNIKAILNNFIARFCVFGCSFLLSGQIILNP